MHEQYVSVRSDGYTFRRSNERDGNWWYCTRWSVGCAVVDVLDLTHHSRLKPKLKPKLKLKPKPKPNPPNAGRLPSWSCRCRASAAHRPLTAWQNWQKKGSCMLMHPTSGARSGRCRCRCRYAETADVLLSASLFVSTPPEAIQSIIVTDRQPNLYPQLRKQLHLRNLFGKPSRLLVSLSHSFPFLSFSLIPRRNAHPFTAHPHELP